MNDARNPRERLIAEALQGDWDNGSAGGMARRAAGHARQGQRMRHAAAAVATTVGLGLVIFLFIGRTSAPPPQERSSAPVALARGYEIISDDELIASLRDRPLLVLPRENGAKTLVVLGR